VWPGLGGKGSLVLKRTLTILLFFPWFFFPFSGEKTLFADKTLKVGVYENEPLVFTNADGKVQGLYIDVLETIAEREGWRIEYVHGTWAQCLDRLEKAGIDLLVGIAYSEERDERFDFTNETLLSNWGQLYTGKINSGIESILDLSGKRVAVLKGDVYSKGFRSILRRFGIKSDFVQVETYSQVFRILEQGEADAALITRLYGLLHEKDFNVFRSPVICCPVELRFAVPEGRNLDIASTIDRYLMTLKEDKGSVYYRSMNRWFGVGGKPTFPVWFWWVLGGAGSLVLLFLAGNFFLRAQVRARTRELEEQITARNLAEERLRRQSEQLEQTVSERTAELQARVREVEHLNRALANLLEDFQGANRNLERTSKQLERANEELEAFTYSVSHDLRAPLRAMEGFAQALLEDYAEGLSQEGREYARRITASARRMDVLIQDLLQYSRLSRMKVELFRVSLEQVMDRVLAQLEAEIRERGAVMDVARPLPEVYGNPLVLEQILANLLSNAIKFVAPGVRPRVRIRPEVEENRVRIWVEDNGIGVPAEHRERIFRIFECLHGIETYEGTGVGLAIVKRGVERMEGRFGLEPGKREGSRFWVDLKKA